MTHYALALLVAILQVCNKAFAIEDLAVAERDCLAFINNPRTDPLKDPDENIKRDIRLDNIAEHTCETILKYVNPSMENRIKIHEALGMLSVRHVEMGYNRHANALKHFKTLAKTVPTNYMLSVRAGQWAMDWDLNNYKDSVYFLRNALYGEASNDTSTTADRIDTYKVKRDLAHALGFIGKYKNASQEFLDLLSLQTDDFEAAYLLKESMKQYILTTQNKSFEFNETFQKVILESDELYNNISKFSHNKYKGYNKSFVEVYNEVPSNDEMTDMIKLRQPIHFSVGLPLNESLLWKVHKWNTSYLIDKAGEESVLILVHPINVQSYVGFGPDIYFKRRTLKSFLEGRYAKTYKETMINGIDVSKMNTTSTSDSSDSETSEPMDPYEVELEKMRKDGATIFEDKKKKAARKKKELKEKMAKGLVKIKEFEEFLGFRGASSQKEILRPPLNKLMYDLPRPTFLVPFWEDVLEGQMFLGNSRSANGTSTRIKYDSLDRFYINIEGNITIDLLPPSYALHMKTISPIYYVLNNGFSLQYQPKLRDRAGEDKTTYFYSQASTFNDTILGPAAGQQVSVTILPQEMIYIPAGWFFQMHLPEGQHMGVTFTWKPYEWKNTIQIEKTANATLFKKLGLISDVEVEEAQPIEVEVDPEVEVIDIDAVGDKKKNIILETNQLEEL